MSFVHRISYTILQTLRRKYYQEDHSNEEDSSRDHIEQRFRLVLLLGAESMIESMNVMDDLIPKENRKMFSSWTGDDTPCPVRTRNGNTRLLCVVFVRND